MDLCDLQVIFYKSNTNMMKKKIVSGSDEFSDASKCQMLAETSYVRYAFYESVRIFQFYLGFRSSEAQKVGVN